jgi:hypothetical protein
MLANILQSAVRRLHLRVSPAPPARPPSQQVVLSLLALLVQTYKY